MNMNVYLLLSLSIIGTISAFLLTYQSTMVIVLAITEEGGDKTTSKDKDKDKKQKGPGDNGVFCADSGPCVGGPPAERCNRAQCIGEVCEHVNANGGCDDNSRGQSRHPNNRGGDSNSNSLGQIPVIQPLQGNLSMSNP